MNFKISKKMFNEVYIPHLADYDKRFEVYYGGAGSGKSVWITQKLIYKYLQHPNRKCLIIRKVNNSLRDSVFALLKSILGDWQLYDQCKINKTELSIELPNGSSFIMKGLDDSEKIKSIANIDDIWIEECTEIDEFDFDQLCLRLRSKKPYNQVFCSFNPVSKSNWVYKRWFSEEATYNKTTTQVLHTTYKDNKFLPQSYIDNLLEMENSNPVYYRIYALGEFATLDKLVFTNWEVRTFDYKEILKTRKDSLAIFGLDFGYVNDPTAFTGLVVDDLNKEIYWFEDYQQKGLTNDEIAEKIIELGFRKEIISADSAEQKSIEEIRRCGIPRIRAALKGKDSILNGIQLMQQYKIYIHPSCVNAQEEMKNYTWTKDRRTNEYINKPIDKYNHSIDSARYALQTHIRLGMQKVKLLDRKSLF